MASEPPVDKVVGAIQLARARARYQGFTRGVSASLMDIQWLIGQIQEGKNEGALGKEGELLVKRYLEMEVPYRLDQMKEFLEALEEAGLDVGELPQSLEKLASERERLLTRVQTQQSEGEAAGAVPEELAGFASKLDSMGAGLDKQAHDFLLTFIQTNKISRELANSLLEGEETA